MATVQNGDAVEGTVNVVTPAKERAAAVSTADFKAFLFSEQARSMTVEQAASHLKMNKLTFSQRLNTLRKERKDLLKSIEDNGGKLVVNGQTITAANVSEIPKLKDGRVGRTGPRQELSAGQRALLSFVKAE